ncbi:MULTISPECIES: hypothetical protein [unclassified Streptomyces]|uniref:hypothetical protein n=1 Tax=unclassified Streptomyces TaxID=2593676 RepID=UPI0033C12783
MAKRSTDPLAGVVSATAKGERLVFVPSRVREFSVALGGSFFIPLWIAAPLLLPALVIAVLTESGVVWALFWVGLGLTVLAMIGLFLASILVVSTTTVRWVEFRPQGNAQQLVIASFLRSSTVSVADLQRVVIVERIRLGQRKSLKVVLYTRAGKRDCEPGFQAPMSRVDAKALLDWLTTRLRPAHVAVEYRTEVDRNFVCPDEWWAPSSLAALWHVPVGSVDALAVRHGVRSYQYTPRGAAMYSPGKTVMVYDPARVHEVAEKLLKGHTREKHTMGPESDGTKEVPHP